MAEGVHAQASGSPARQGSSGNIRDFVAAKNPKNDNQFVAVVAYCFRFEAPPGQRKEFITSDDLQEACRQAGRERLKNPISTLNNAHCVGLLDRTKVGEFTVNAVGENTTWRCCMKWDGLARPRKTLTLFCATTGTTFIRTRSILTEFIWRLVMLVCSGR
jgi:hypothetical protein